ncbi:MAG: hypothetical protein F4062_08050 [Acidimicrobiia bacterium]|nr:hypothetical protein [Acidimicrobiia bacterium]
MRSETLAPVLSMHQSTTRMVAAAAAGLVAQPSRGYEPPLQAACPNFGYAFECLGKATLIYHNVAAGSEIPDDEQIKSWASGIGRTGGATRKAMRGHHVQELVRTVLDQCEGDVPELRRLIEQPFVQQSLAVVTAFHAFLRYDWIRSLRSEEHGIAFDATVFMLQQLHLADMPTDLASYPFEQAEWHNKTFLPRVADALVDVYFALTLGLARTAESLGERSGRLFIEHCVIELPERAEHLLGLNVGCRWDEPTRGAWGEYCL